MNLPKKKKNRQEKNQPNREKIFITDNWEIMRQQGISFNGLMASLRKDFKVIVLSNEEVKIIRIEEKEER